MKHEIIFHWTDKATVASDIRMLDFIPRIGERVELGVVSTHGFVERRVKDVTYVLNTSYISIELED
jgi:hypothetical protein